MLNLMFALLLTLTGGDCTKFDLIIVCDYSGSVKGHENEIAEAVNVFSKGLEVGEYDTKLGIVTFSDYSEVFCSLTTDTVYLNNRLKALYGVESNTTTNLSSALLTAYEELNNRGRPNIPKIVIVISDGLPDKPEESLDVAGTLKLLDVEICTLLINSSTTDAGYMKQLSSPNMYFHTNYQNLLKSLQNINFCL